MHPQAGGRKHEQAFLGFHTQGCYPSYFRAVSELQVGKPLQEQNPQGPLDINLSILKCVFALVPSNSHLNHHCHHVRISHTETHGECVSSAEFNVKIHVT